MASPFTIEEHKRIDAAIVEIERSTAADLSVVVTRVSDRYSLYPIAFAAAGAILSGALVTMLRPDIASGTTICRRWRILASLVCFQATRARTTANAAITIVEIVLITSWYGLTRSANQFQ